MVKVTVSDGIYLVKPYAEYFQDLQNGELDAFVKGSKIAKAGEVYFLCAKGKQTLGVIQIKSVRPITLDEFRTLQPNHKISTLVRQIWWGLREPLYYYEIKLLKRFKKPMQYNNYTTGVPSVIKNVELSKNGK